ncbi:MAG: DMT family transporter [Propioniciclava sp.]
MRRSWVLLLSSAILEAVWATALGASAGFTRIGATLVFGVAIIASMTGLAMALRRIAVGTGYAVWTGVGAALTVAWAMATGTEPVTAVRTLLLAGIIVAVAGLALTEQPQAEPTAADQVEAEDPSAHCRHPPQQS